MGITLLAMSNLEWPRYQKMQEIISMMSFPSSWIGNSKILILYFGIKTTFMTIVSFMYEDK
jgi:hypothetical protein